MQNTGMGFLGWLQILFIGLKLTHLLNWSWLWVLSPIWIPIALTIGFMIVIGIAACVAAVADAIDN